MKIQHLIVKRLCVSYETAQAYIKNQQVKIDDDIAIETSTVEKHQRVVVDGKIAQEGIKFFYLAYH